MALKILLTNDDGIDAVGLAILYEKVKSYGDVYVVAPKYNQSAKSHSINIKGGFEVKKSDLFPNAYSVDSTPADCVRFAMYGLQLEFDIVLSGINKGYNIGEDIAYSGTVGAAIEGAMLGKPSIAFSCPYDKWTGAEFLPKVMDYITQNLFKHGKLYNVNFPEEPKGIKITKQGNLHYHTHFINEENLLYQKGKPDYVKGSLDKESDVAAVNDGYISITPLVIDKTDNEIFKIFNK